MTETQRAPFPRAELAKALNEGVQEGISAAAAAPFQKKKYSQAASTGARWVFSYFLVRRLARTAPTLRGRIGWRIYQGLIAVAGIVGLGLADKVLEERERRLAQLPDAQRDYLLKGK